MAIDLPTPIRYDVFIMTISAEDKAVARIGDVEVRVAYQDKLLLELDDVVRSFSLRVERLERELLELRTRVAAENISPSNDAPPHY